MKKIIVAGATGSMGQKAVKLISKRDDCQLVGAFAPHLDNQSNLPKNVKCFQKLSEIDLTADVWLDFTVPQAVYDDTKFALEHQMRPIIGTSGLDSKQIVQLQQLAVKNHLGGIIAPNFGLSAVLLMKFAHEAAKYFPQAEIVEMHHEDKLDAPSGTAIATAQLIAQGRQKSLPQNLDYQAARGADYNGVKIHAVRLPGYIAHEQVLFGGPGEALTIRQDSFDRESFMQGVAVALDQVMSLKELVVGLEKIL